MTHARPPHRERNRPSPRRRLAMLLAATLALAAAAPAALRAQSEEGPGDSGQSQQRRFGGGDRGFGRGFGSVSEEEWREASTFMKEHSPRRLQLFQDLLDSNRIGPQRADFMRTETVNHFRRLRRLQDDDPGLYAIRLKRLTADDNIFALTTELREADEARRSELREKLRGEVKNLIALSFQEREHRIANLERTLARERERLARDQERLEDFVDRRLNAVVTQGVPPGMGEGPGGPGGPGPGPGAGPRGDRPPPPPPPPPGERSAAGGASAEETERAMRERRQREAQTTQPTQPAAQ